MTVEEMHYDLKVKLNKIDSQNYKNLRIPEIDWILNEAQEIFVKNIAFPRVSKHNSLESNQRLYDDIKNLVVEDKTIQKQGGDLYLLPEDYLFYISSVADMQKDRCSVREGDVYLLQHSMDYKRNTFENTSYQWREISATLNEEGIKLHNSTEQDITFSDLRLTYIKRPKYIHNAKDFLPTQNYKLPNGKLLTGKQDCELPEHTHREIVDLAVLIASNNLDSQNFQFKQLKLALNQFI